MPPGPVAERLAGLKIDLFREQANIIAERKQMIELLFGFDKLAALRDLIHSPEATGHLEEWRFLLRD